MAISPAPTSVEFCRRLSQKFGDNFYAMGGRTYDRIVHEDQYGNRRSFCVMDRSFGNIYKTESWARPAKGVRYNGDNMDNAVEQADIHGSFLYAK